MSTALLGNFDKSITGHVLNTYRSIVQSKLNECDSHLALTFMCFMHELKQFIDYGLQELPVSLEEAWVLSDNVHDI